MSSDNRKISADTVPYTTEHHVMWRGPKFVAERNRKSSVDPTDVTNTENLSTTPQRRFSITGMLFGQRGPRMDRQSSISSETSEVGSPETKISVTESPEFKHFIHRQSKMFDDFST